MRYLSLFSGMEAAHLAWAPLGWECAGVAEIDPNACAVLRHRLPGVPNLGSVTGISDEQIAALGRIDVVIGGSPCQDLSVAGKRAGLAGARSGLFHEQLRIFHAARTLCGARWLLWENVPGAFSSNAGRDFAAVVGAMAGCDVGVPVDGWRNEGACLGENGLVEWSVLDAQWFGVAQRRRRVFALLDTGDWANRPPVLLEPESLRGDSAPRREAREGTAAGAPRGAALGGVAPITGTLATSGGHAYPGTCAQDAGEGFLVAMAHGQGGAEISTDGGAPCLTCNHEAPIVAFPQVAHTLRADGFDASEDGTVRGTPLVPVAFDIQQITSKTNRSRVEPGMPAPTLVGVGGHHVAFVQNQRDEVRTMEVAGALAAEPGAKQQTYLAIPAVAFMADDYKDGGYEEAETARPMTTSADRTRAAPIAAHAMAVRRLTPRECERLQGAPDDWTLVPNRGKPMADGPRYKMLGNSFAVPVIRWIGESIERAVRACP